MFKSIITTVPTFKSGRFNGNIVSEINLSGCSLTAANINGGPITKDALRQIQQLFPTEMEAAAKANLEPIINVSISPLLPGQYPEVPGWHCDGVPYNKTHGAPDFNMVHNSAFNVSLTLSSEMMGVAAQEYVNDVLKPRIWDEHHVFRDLHREVARIQPRLVVPGDGQFVLYTPRTMVRAKACHRRGYQYHLRMSFYEKPTYLNRVGGVRTVYQLSEENGR